MSGLMKRMTIATAPRWRNILRRKLPQIGAADREIHLQRFLVFLGLLFGHYVVGDFLDRRGIEHLGIDRHDDAIDLDLDRRAGGKKHVRRLLFGHQFE